MLKLNPSLIYSTDYIIDHPDPEYKIREMGDRILDELYLENDVVASRTGLILLSCVIPIGVDTVDLYHDIYHIYKHKKRWTCKCDLQYIIQSCMGYTLHGQIPHLSHKYDCKFVRYVVNLALDMKCTLSDIWDIILRRSIQYDNETQMECTINSLGWLDNESYWYLKRNTHIGMIGCEKSLGIILPYGGRYDTYIGRSYMSSTISERSPRWGQNYLKTQPSSCTVIIPEMNMKDSDILIKYGMLPRYTSKQELIDLLRNIGYNRMYEIYDKKKYYGRETCINMEIINKKTNELFIVDNNLYTLDEIVDSCSNGMKFGNYPISKELGEDLKYFLKYYEEHDAYNIVSKYLEDSKDPIISMKHEILKDTTFKRFLIYILEVGLYARRWRGHGQPFPYKSLDTDNMDNNLYMRRMNNLNIKIMKIVNSIEFSWYRDNIILHKEHGSMRKKFIPYYIGMIDGKECIRMMAESLIYTGSYYLQSIYNYKYHDDVGNILDIKQLQFMNPISPEERNI